MPQAREAVPLWWNAASLPVGRQLAGVFGEDPLHFAWQGSWNSGSAAGLRCPPKLRG